MPLQIEEIRATYPLRPIHYFPIIDSTMAEATRSIEAGESDGAIIIAEEQTAGIGRLGRAWHSEADVGTYCSFILNLPVPAETIPVLTLTFGLATAEAIEKAAGVSCDLRWPNDVLINHKKTAGILIQLHNHTVIAGIGINVNHTSLPEGLRTPATSLRIESGQPQSREQVLIELIRAVDGFCKMLLEQGPSTILTAFSRKSSFVMNRRVVIEEGPTVQRGTTAGLDSRGFLLLREDSGAVKTIYAGGVRPEE